MSNFDWTDCLAGCEERWGPGGREVDGRRVTLWDPSMVLVQTQQEACGRWKSILIQHSVLTMQYGSGSENKSGSSPCRDALKQTNKAIW
jgi:hypothetical protein